MWLEFAFSLAWLSFAWLCRLPYLCLLVFSPFNIPFFFPPSFLPPFFPSFLPFFQCPYSSSDSTPPIRHLPVKQSLSSGEFHLCACMRTFRVFIYLSHELMALLKLKFAHNIIVSSRSYERLTIKKPAGSLVVSPDGWVRNGPL